MNHKDECVCVCVCACVYVWVSEKESERRKGLLLPLFPLDCKCVLSSDQNYNNNTYIL